MLRELHVRNLALIEEASLEFGHGLNVLSGETGAGKTVLVEALGLLLGGRGDSGLVRAGARRLELEADFEAPPQALEAAAEEGIEPAGGDSLVLRRVITPDGKSRCYVNGTICTVATLARLGERLVDIHGQHDHQRLLRTASHLAYLDASGTKEHHDLLRSYREAYARWRDARGMLERASMDESERLREIDLLRFQTAEIETAGPREGELEELLKERKRMQNREELFNAVREAHALIAGEAEGEGAMDRVGSAEAALERASSLDEEIMAWTTRLREAQEQLADLAHELRAYAEGLEFEPGHLEEVELRLRVLSELARKYGRDTSLILEHLERSRQRLSELEYLDTKREELQKEEAARRSGMEKMAARLSASRKELARKLARDANRELSELNMAGMRFSVEMSDGGDCDERGRDGVEFRVSPGKGLPYQPMARIASGGELSRIMLALKLSLARADDVPTLVFDEVDAGIGGSTADILAEKLASVSGYHQVFAVTHLPQVAAYADIHMSVSKMETPDGIATRVELLEGGGRVDELARMLGGSEDTARKHARSMLGKKEISRR
ncbi:MAG: DNA repair protein RecN [Actinomycetota bacterium]|nr:DNA repair protein RecN [Actinomycetota bacterium]MDD5666584.1 DNA repair protein RecN [Actinomycetota bacterium]